VHPTPSDFATNPDLTKLNMKLTSSTMGMATIKNSFYSLKM
jgi:hypothetical protein